ncbi:MAG: DinB family protein [Anaerolineales bacterium]|nr:DinB family protein [Anaerolineales bacterium]
MNYGPRYEKVLLGSGIEFHPPTDISELIVIEKHDGNATTDFGSPAVTPDSDREPIDRKDYASYCELLQACWNAFDRAVQQASGKELRKGPRGGGRDLEKIMRHVLEAEQAYLGRLAWKISKSGQDTVEQLEQIRQDILSVLKVAADGGLPEQGPRGGALWAPRYFIRRVTWHVLDHAWEIEDRIIYY